MSTEAAKPLKVEEVSLEVKWWWNRMLAFQFPTVSGVGDFGDLVPRGRKIRRISIKGQVYDKCDMHDDSIDWYVKLIYAQSIRRASDIGCAAQP